VDAWMCLVVVSSSQFDLCVVAFAWLSTLHVAPTSPFIASKGRAQVTFMVRGENEQQMWPWVWPSSSFFGENSSPIA
jgi:hypothetical protein